LPNGVWTRTFTHGWIAVNPTAATRTVTPPPGLVPPGSPRPTPAPAPTTATTPTPTPSTATTTTSAPPTSTPAPAQITLEAADAVILVDPPARVVRRTVTRDGFRVGNLRAS